MRDFLLSVGFWDSAIRLTGPIALAALASLLCSRAGVLYVGVEGVMVAGAFAAIGGANVSHSVPMGLALGALAGVILSLAMGAFSMLLRMGDIVGGLMVHIGALGLTAFLARQWFPAGMNLNPTQFRSLAKPSGSGLQDLVLHQQPLVYVVLLTVIGIELFLRTRWGLRLRSSGEAARVAVAFGFRLKLLRFAVLAVSGALAGMAGGSLALIVVGSFDPGMINGRGFIALACVMLGGWRPLGVVAAALLFGASDAFQIRLTAAAGLGQYLAILPYALTLLAMATIWGRARGPQEEGRGLPE